MAVVRVKRKCSEEPLDILLLACKRVKTVENVPETSVFKFAATVSDQEDSSLHFTHPFKSDAESIIKRENRRFEEIKKKLHEEHDSLAKNNRYKVVNCYRSLNDDDFKNETEEIENTNKKGLTVLDVESHEVKDDGGTHEATSSGSNYVYDLYYAADNTQDLNDLQLEHVHSVLPFNTELVFGSYRNGDSDENIEDEDDSNDENNWRNDYPDEEDIWSDKDIDEDDEDGNQLASRMRSFKIGEDDDSLSSDDDDEDQIYNGKLDPEDIDNFGESYAKYKARVNRNEYDTSCSVNSNDSS